ncbi:hypothetical protein KSU01_08200 [Fusobacterium animalis]|uniref:hypothetical protein n=1 Tax=Fusobacterium animalis TaxID=76859 RepID=UPI0030CB1197
MLNILDILKIIRDLIIVIVPMIFSYFMYIKTKEHGEIAKKEEEQHNLLKEKLNKVYFPVYLKHITEIVLGEKYIISQADANNISYFNALHSVDNIILENLYHIPTETQKLFIDFHVTLLNCYPLELENNNPQKISEDEYLSILFDSIDETYKKLYSTLIKEYEDICNKLDLPNPIK